MNNKESIIKTINNLKRRLSAIGIDLEYGLNYPWIYLEYINGIRVKEKYHSQHGYTIAYLHKPKLLNRRGLFKFLRTKLNT